MHYVKKIRTMVIILVWIILCIPAVSVKAAGPVRPEVPRLRGIADKNTVTLTWNPVKNASGYQIYLYYGAEKGFKCIKTIGARAERKLTLVGSLDRIYSYKIRAYNRKNGRNAYSSLSKELQVKTSPKIAEISSIRRRYGHTAVISWKKIPSADGYQVVRAEKRGGPYTRIAIIHGNDTQTYTDSGLEKGKGYYYRVRAYRKNPGNVVYGAYSVAGYAGTRPLMVIGDSRTVMMENAVGNEAVSWICKSSMGYTWLKETAVKEAQELLKGNDDVFIWLGVNDVHNISNYISYINEIAREWKKTGVNVYVLAVGPVETDPYVTNEEIEDFNARMKAGLEGVWHLDLYSYLEKVGYKTIDGIHYDNETSNKIYSYIMKQIR